MNENQALLALAGLALLSGRITRRYVARDTRVVLSVFGALMSFANLLDA